MHIGTPEAPTNGAVSGKMFGVQENTEADKDAEATPWPTPQHDAVVEVLSSSIVAVEDALLSCVTTSNMGVRRRALHAYVSRLYRPFLEGDITWVEVAMPGTGVLVWKLRRTLVPSEGVDGLVTGILVWARDLEGAEAALQHVAVSPEVAAKREGTDATLLHVLLTGTLKAYR